MTPIVLDTDVASLSFKRHLPPVLLARLAGREPVITFVTLGELTRWVEWRNWGPSRRAHLTKWLGAVGVLHSTDKVSRVWGEILHSPSVGAGHDPRMTHGLQPAVSPRAFPWRP